MYLEVGIKFVSTLEHAEADEWLRFKGIQYVLKDVPGQAVDAILPLLFPSLVLKLKIFT